VYLSDALLPENASEDWDIAYHNVAVLCESNVSPKEFMARIHKIEKQLGRNPNAPRWSPRIIDIDILLIDNIIINNGLMIPHIEFLSREFCLVPAVDIAPEMMHPITKCTLLDHLISFKENNELKIKKIKNIDFLV